jgi:GT2 family glycosyltransferase
VRSEIVLCTRNRAADVERLLADLPRQTVKPPILFVDSSDAARTEELVARFGASGLWSAVRYLRAEAGLTKQRAAGVAAVGAECDVVHFIDDDVLLDPEYFRGIETVFERDPEAVGVGGWITNEPMHRPRWSGRMFLLDSTAQGRVLRSGVNTFVYRAAGDLRVDWLSGASMSYRRSVFETVQFDTAMIGYSLGEDVDFSYQAGRCGHLWVTPHARLVHLTSAANRWDPRRFTCEDVLRRHAFVMRNRGAGLSLVAFWWSVFGDGLLTSAKTVLYPDRATWRSRLGGLSDGLVRLLGRRESS